MFMVPPGGRGGQPPDTIGWVKEVLEFFGALLRGSPTQFDRALRLVRAILWPLVPVAIAVGLVVVVVLTK